MFDTAIITIYNKSVHICIQIPYTRIVLLMERLVKQNRHIAIHSGFFFDHYALDTNTIKYDQSQIHFLISSTATQKRRWIV